MLAEQLGNFDLLESDLRYLIKLEPDHSEALNALGYSLVDRTDRFDEALPLIQRALKLSPNNPAIIDSLGWLYFRQGNIKDAGPLLERAFELMADHEIAAHYGEYLWAIGEQDEAWKIWNQGLKQMPDSTIIKRTLERLNLELPSA
jgi:Flp pilus assembly protein TadD